MISLDLVLKVKFFYICIYVQVGIASSVIYIIIYVCI